MKLKVRIGRFRVAWMFSRQALGYTRAKSLRQAVRNFVHLGAAPGGAAEETGEAT